MPNIHVIDENGQIDMRAIKRLFDGQKDGEFMWLLLLLIIELGNLARGEI